MHDLNDKFEKVRVSGASVNVHYHGEVDDESGYIAGGHLFDQSLGLLSQNKIDDAHNLIKDAPHKGLRLVYLPRQPSDYEYSSLNRKVEIRPKYSANAPRPIPWGPRDTSIHATEQQYNDAVRLRLQDIAKWDIDYQINDLEPKMKDYQKNLHGLNVLSIPPIEYANSSLKDQTGERSVQVISRGIGSGLVTGNKVVTGWVNAGEFENIIPLHYMGQTPSINNQGMHG